MNIREHKKTKRNRSVESIDPMVSGSFEMTTFNRKRNTNNQLNVVNVNRSHNSCGKCSINFYHSVFDFFILFLFGHFVFLFAQLNGWNKFNCGSNF